MGPIDIRRSKSEQNYGGPVSPSEVEVTGRSSLRQLSFATEFAGNCTGWVFGAAIASTQQVAVADALTTTGILWSTAMTDTSTNGHGTILSQLDAIHSITTGHYQPYTSVVCEYSYDVIRGTNDTGPVAFPAYSGLGVQIANAIDSNSSVPPGGTLTYPNLTKSDLLNTPGSPGEHRLRWVELPFNNTTIGAVVLNAAIISEHDPESFNVQYRCWMGLIDSEYLYTRWKRYASSQSGRRRGCELCYAQLWYT